MVHGVGDGCAKHHTPGVTRGLLVTSAGRPRRDAAGRAQVEGDAGCGRQPPRAGAVSLSAPAERGYGDGRDLTVVVIVPVLSLQSVSTMKAVMPFWKCVPLPFTAKLFGFLVEMMLSELNGRFGVCR